MHFEKKNPWIALPWRIGRGLDYGTGDLGWLHGVTSLRVGLPMTS